MGPKDKDGEGSSATQGNNGNGRDDQGDTESDTNETDLEHGQGIDDKDITLTGAVAVSWRFDEVWTEAAIIVSQARLHTHGGRVWLNTYTKFVLPSQQAWLSANTI